MFTSYQPESLNLLNDDFALGKDLIVSLWIQCRAFLGKEPLREVYSGDFVIVDNHLWDDFEDF